MYRIKPSSRISVGQGGLIVGLGTKQLLVERERENEYAEILSSIEANEDPETLIERGVASAQSLKEWGNWQSLGVQSVFTTDQEVGFGRLGIGGDGHSGQKLAQYFTDYEAPSCMVNNSFAGAMAMADLMNFWAGGEASIQSRNKRVGISNLSFEKLQIPMGLDPECAVCSHGGMEQTG